MLRYGLSGWLHAATGWLFPIGTLGVNVLGSFIIGLVLELRGLAAYGASNRLPTARVPRLSEDVPILAEIVDSEARSETLLKTLHRLLEESGCGGLVTMEAVEAIRSGPRDLRRPVTTGTAPRRQGRNGAAEAVGAEA